MATNINTSQRRNGLLKKLLKFLGLYKEIPDTQEMTNKAKGDAFENYVISKFDRKFFALKEMRSDKGIKGFYPESNKYPDLTLEYKPNSTTFAVECKWRKNWWRKDGKEGLNWVGDNGDKKIQNYNDFSEKNNITVFVVIGVGGKPDNPEELFTIPLKKLTHCYAEESYLYNYLKKNKDRNFFFDSQKNNLR